MNIEKTDSVELTMKQETIIAFFYSTGEYLDNVSDEDFRFFSRNGLIDSRKELTFLGATLAKYINRLQHRNLDVSVLMSLHKHQIKEAWNAPWEEIDLHFILTDKDGVLVKLWPEPLGWGCKVQWGKSRYTCGDSETLQGALEYARKAYDIGEEAFFEEFINAPIVEDITDASL